MPKRKISFNYIFLKEGDVENPIQEPLCRLLDYLCQLSRIERKQDISSEKFAFIDSYSEEVIEGCVVRTLLFKSARHSYRAPLLNRNTVVARENPKTMEEGEQMKTHALIKFKDGDAILFLETGNNLLSCQNIIDYLNKSLLLYNSQFSEEEKIMGKFCFDMIARDDFREVLWNMNRVVGAEIFVDKSILGSDMLNYATPTEEMKENIVVSIKAERNKSIAAALYQIVDHFNGAQSQIKRIRVRGKLPNGNDCLIDTGFIVKKEYVEVLQDKDTGEFDSSAMFSQLKALAQGY